MTGRLLAGGYLVCLVLTAYGCADERKDTEGLSLGERMSRIEKRQDQMEAAIEKAKRGEWER